MRHILLASYALPSVMVLGAWVGARAESATAGAGAQDQAVTYSNTEEVYFDGEAGREAAPKLTVNVKGGNMTYLDDFGIPAQAPKGITVVKIDRDIVTLNTGKRTTILRRGNPITCWAAIRKDQPKPDGKEDWLFVREIKSHDQGGQMRVGGGDSGAPAAMFRVRSVYWPKPSTSRPSKVIYVHTADDPVRAVSYSWANIDASRVGINLRWIQASCTVDGAERESDIKADSFRG